MIVRVKPVAPEGTGTIAPLRGGSLGLGILPGTRYYDRVESLRSGDMLVLYTDGLTEARSGSGEMFGLDRLKRTALECRRMGAREAVDAIVDRVVRWRVAAEFVDDITLVVAKRV